jgi:hypothetical protein
MPAHVNDTHIALISKKLITSILADYRQISLCNAIYKIIAKPIANRLKPYLLALKSWKCKAFMLKIDLAKAFDGMEWNFIVAALTRKGLHSHFINLIYACISSPTFPIFINGQPFANFRGDSSTRLSLISLFICPCYK